jgi:TolB-like protein/DNA-binding winged helix-turn-helix (wHTH) protein/tetratricopeptide (TPR) repeat protein
MVRFGPFELDLQTGALTRDGRYERLPVQPAQLLLVLVNSRGKLVTREELRAQLWPEDTFVDFDHGLNNAVNRIREVLRDSAASPRYIQTVPRRGYRFIGELEEEEVAAPPIGVEASVPTQPSLQSPAPETRRRITRPGWLAAWFAIALCMVVTIVGLKWRAQTHAGQNAPPIRSLAVLPLKNLSGDPGQGFLADGMTEELIGRLAAIHDLRVISRTSVMQFQDPKETVPAIAKTLGVDAIVEGSISREGNRIRVHAQLIRASNDEHFWSETYDREMGDVFSLESEIAQSIAEKVEVTVSGQERARLVAKRQVSPEVYESYLKGIYADRNTRAGFEQSVAFFEDAIKKDPTFAPAYLGLASAYGDLGTVYGGVSPSETRPKIFAALHKALDLDPDLAEAHGFLAGTYQQDWRWQESQAEFARALALKPNDAAERGGYAGWLLSQGRVEEAVTWARSAHELDPLDVGLLINNGFLLFHARRYDESIQTLRSALAVDRDSAVAHWFLGYDLIAKGQPEQAIPVLEKALLLSGRSSAVIGVLVRAYAHAGRRDDALRLVAELKRRREAGYVPAAAFVNAYLGLGDNEQAFVWLERAYQEKSTILQFLKTHPHFDPIRGDPRFTDLIRRVGLDREYTSSL